MDSNPLWCNINFGKGHKPGMDSNPLWWKLKLWKRTQTRMGLKPALRQTRSLEKDTNPEVTVVSLEFEFYSPLGLCPLWVCVLHCATLIKACKGLKPGFWYAQWFADSNPGFSPPVCVHPGLCPFQQYSPWDPYQISWLGGLRELISEKSRTSFVHKLRKI